MSKTRPGLDRIGKQHLLAAKRLAVSTMRDHVKACDICIAAGEDVRRMCSEWWELARLMHTAHRALKEWERDETENMTPLPGMENL